MSARSTLRNATPVVIGGEHQSRAFSVLDDIGTKDWRARGDLQPAPRSLAEVVKLPLLRREDSSTVSVVSVGFSHQYFFVVSAI